MMQLAPVKEKSVIHKRTKISPGEQMCDNV